MGKNPSPNGCYQFKIKAHKIGFWHVLNALSPGNLGNYRSVGGGVFELRLDFGPGYRIYFGQVGNTIVLLLCGGDKSSQTRDIESAKTYWLEYKERH